MMERLLVLALGAALCGCGSSGDDGGGGGGNPASVSIQTQTLDQGNVGHSFFQQLAANGGSQPYSWWVSTSGDPLPAGMSLTSDGRLAGVPNETAARSVVFVVQDASSSLDLTTLSIEVRDVELQSSASGAVVPGTSVTFQASGGQATYSFALQTNASGGSVTSGGNYTAGSNSGVDVVRATDQDGFFEEATVTVGQDPFVGFQALFGSTDVWWLNWDVVYDPSPAYATDFDAVLADLGLRNAGSTGATGTEADELARLLVIRRTLGHLSTFYGNTFDANDAPGGLAISFVGPSGPGSGTTPPVAGVFSAMPNRYSTICARHGPTAGVVGTAWLDPGNGNVEHDCGQSGNAVLGVFVNRVRAASPSYFGTVAPAVGAGDVDGLRAMLLGGSPQGARQQQMFGVADRFARVAAAVFAHEIGHSLGLQHSNPSAGPGDIMNASLSVGGSVSYAFNSNHWAQLMGDLPGPNR